LPPERTDQFTSDWRISLFNTSPKGSPKISIDKPSVSSPTNIEISFKADDGAEIDVESLEVLYGWLSLNITDRIREHALNLL
jgi:hypothetical protein